MMIHEKENTERKNALRALGNMPPYIVELLKSRGNENKGYKLKTSNHSQARRIGENIYQILKMANGGMEPESVVNGKKIEMTSSQVSQYCAGVDALSGLF